MRIIKQNTIERIHRCENCGSIYAYLPEDVDRNGSPTVRCPVCNRLNLISIFDKKVKDNSKEEK